ncbi:hypothetical protein JX265_000164 [Neoarthrinium moseri]|uniref:Uncharacterized protein n=1 Tax=Neoarthrinium moseri TaxID=1658444 RepID=A0A9Q0AS01_9PEZI|nr:hypothetical protein JX265_000164 [Neoarthrinium moseri]
MGFLSFWSRKPPPVSEDTDVLKAQPYNATVASLPPILGTLPVAGNGPSILEAIQRTKIKSQLRKAPSYSTEAYVPTPSIRKLRQDESGRPQTAPTEDQAGWLGRRRSASLKEHPVPQLPTISQGNRPPYRLPGKLPDRSDKPRPPIVKLPEKIFDASILNKPLPAIAHEKTSSINSSNSAATKLSRGFVDLLDAQAGFQSTDLYQRVQATGARSYGEDVADRNVGASGVKLNSTETSTHHSMNSASAARSQNGGDEDLLSKSRKRHSLGAGLRTTSLDSETYAVRSKAPGTDPPLPPKSPLRRRIIDDEAVSASTKADRRKSLPSYLHSSQRKHVQDSDSDFPDSLKAKGKDAARAADGRLSSIKSVPSPRNSSLDKRRYASRTGEKTHGSKDRDRSTKGRSSKTTKSSRRETLSYASKSAQNHVASKRLSLQSMQMTSTGNDTDGGSIHRARPQSPRSDTQSSSRRDLRMQAFETPRPKSFHKRSGNRDELLIDQFAHTRSPRTAPGKAVKKPDLDETIPERTSSLRHGSMDSTSATSLSSNPFRPQSRHTANTSIDLSPFAKEANFSHDSLGAVSSRTGPDHRLPSPLAVSASSPLRSEVKPKRSTNFNIDDYISSDDDADKPRRPRGEGEEELVFNDSGYGFGFELPGLSSQFDATPLFAPSSPPRSISRSKGRDNERDISSYKLDESTLTELENAYSGSRADYRRRAPRTHVSANRYDDSTDTESSTGEEEQDSEDELSFDIPMTRRSTPLRQYRAARYASREDIIMEERDIEKMDVHTAMRLRKEEKRRKRLSGASGTTIRPWSEKGKEKESVHPHRIDMKGFDADVE